MLHGVELAAVLVARLAERKIGDNVLALQMPGWSSITPATPVAIAFIQGSGLHLLASIDTWEAIASPPASIADRFARVWSWSQRGPDVDALTDGLAELAFAWRQSAFHEVGVLDVAGQITHGAGARLGVERGPFGNVVSKQRCIIGRARSAPRWPVVADVRAGAKGVEVKLDGAESPIVIATVSDILQQLTPILEQVRAIDDACAAACDRLRVVERDAALLGEKMTAFAPWRLTSQFDLDHRAVQAVWISCAAPIGGEVSVKVSEGMRVVCGDTPELDLSSGARSVEDVAEAVARESKVLRAHRLVGGRRYRVRRGFSSASEGAVLVFREVTEVKPSGADHWFFSGDHRSVVLASDDPADVAVLEELDAYLEPITERA